MTLDWLFAGIALLVALGWYLSYSAARLDRLHARVEGTLAALDAQLVRRAEATLELVHSGALDAASSLMLASAASESLAMSEFAEADIESQLFSQDRESVESDLTEALTQVLGEETLAHLDSQGADDPDAMDVLARVRATCLRVQLARRFHNGAVTDVRMVRRKWTVRMFRLAGHAAMPQTVEFRDALPNGWA
ncbi:MAG: hypothetical protein IPL93_08250 [Actinomycetales bacterium]|jgi:hypothetical protein|nr:hypothetical protein [Actinomycetales bacterium]HMT31261.1 hypothetical protein [Dermatophilaceae bacterium]